MTTFVAAAAFTAATFVAATFVAALAFTALTLAAFIAAAFTALAAAFIAAALATFVAAAVAYRVAGAFFEHEAMRTMGHRYRPAIATLEFEAGWAGRRRSRNTFAPTQFVTPRTARRGNRYAVAATEYIAGWAFGAVLVEAGTATPVFAVTAAGECQRAAGAEHEKSNSEKCSHALLHKRSLVSLRGGPTGRTHRPQLHSIECKRVERGAPIAQRVGDVLEVIREALIVG